MAFLKFLILFVTTMVLVPTNGIVEERTSSISKLLRRKNDLEERMQIQERINQEQELLIKALVLEKTKEDNISMKCEQTGTSKIQQRATSGGVAFQAYMSKPEYNTWRHQTVIFDKIITNIGGHYNHYTGIFTAPGHGVYVFLCTLHCNSNSYNAYLYSHLMVNSSRKGGGLCTSDGDIEHSSGVVVVEVNQGDKVYIRTENMITDNIMFISSVVCELLHKDGLSESVLQYRPNTTIRDKANKTTSVVFLTDALSVLQAINNGKLPELEQDVHNIESLQTALQWIPSHCRIKGNDNADLLAKEGAKKKQYENQVGFSEMKTIITSLHTTPQQQDSYHQLARPEQTTIFRLRTGHNRLNQHLHRVMKVIPSPMCPCGEADQNTEHLLQHCRIHQALRNNTWPTPTTLQEKLYGLVEALQKTTRFVEETGTQV
ncbi:uncharacterized protein LOC134241701 [Saccostrea cucullata]|uniref:uncharacterized protein LOC134241701 n=1 Tax=Saccostrea cuccullata TaxID=36930 RepID=UPI002ED32B66